MFETYWLQRKYYMLYVFIVKMYGLFHVIKIEKKIGSIKMLSACACVFGNWFVCCNVQEHAEFVTCLIHQYSRAGEIHVIWLLFWNMKRNLTFMFIKSLIKKHRNRTCNIISTVQRTGCVQPQKSLWIICWYILQLQIRYAVKCYILHTHFTWSNNLAQYMMNNGLNVMIIGLFSLFW